MIIIEERSPKSVPGVTSFFIKFDYNINIINELESLYCKSYNSKTYE